MTHRLKLLPTLLAGVALCTSACSVAPPMTEQETQIKTDLAADRFIPATRQMRDAIETQELFAQAAFWSNEYDINPADLEAAIKLSSSVRKLGNPGRAVEITRTTRALYPQDPYLIAEYAAALIATERSQEAISILDQGLTTTSSYGRLWSLKGAALDQQERYDEARQHYSRALRITPNDPNVMANLGLSFALSGDAPTAEGWLRRAAAQPTASASVRQNLVLVLQLQGKTAEAEKLASFDQSTPRLPTLRSAFNPAPSGQQQFQPQPRLQQARSQQRGPQASLHTGPAQGQTYKSASEAARAVALKRAQLSAGQPLQQQANIQQTQQQAPQQQAPRAAAPNGYPQQNYYAPNAQAPQRRAPSRQRR